MLRVKAFSVQKSLTGFFFSRHSISLLSCSQQICTSTYRTHFSTAAKWGNTVTVTYNSLVPPDTAALHSRCDGILHFFLPNLVYLQTQTLLIEEVRKEVGKHDLITSMKIESHQIYFHMGFSIKGDYCIQIVLCCLYNKSRNVTKS